jgi:hypothetical protein
MDFVWWFVQRFVECLVSIEVPSPCRWQVRTKQLVIIPNRISIPYFCVCSIATSAPVLAQLDFPEYNEVVQRSLTYFSGGQCAATIARATQEITNLLETQAGTQQVQVQIAS